MISLSPGAEVDSGNKWIAAKARAPALASEVQSRTARERVYELNFSLQNTVIAITKDLPDVEGDLKYNIKTFATQLGVRGVAFLGAIFQTMLSVSIDFLLSITFYLSL